MEDQPRRLPDAELEVMQAVWSLEAPVTSADIERAIDRPMAKTTLLTLLTRLGDKGFISIEKRGRAGVYAPLISEHDYLCAQSRRFIDKLFNGSMPAFAAALCESGLSREELDELRALIEEKRL